MQGKLLAFYFFVLYIYNAASSSLFTITDWAPVYFSFIPVLLSIIVAAKYHVSFFKRKFVLLFGILLIWNIAQYIFNNISPSPYALMLSVVVWVAYNVFHKDFADRFIKITLFLAKIGLVVWVLSLMIPTIVDKFGKTFGIETMNVSYSFLLFNISKGISLRNYGCCWEPGRYSCILITAIFFFYQKYGFAKSNPKFLLLLFSLITTVSTTGIFAFGAFLAYHIFKTKKINPLYWIPIVALSFWVWSMPFMSEKIETFSGADHFENSLSVMEWNSKHGQNNGNVYCPQRFDGLAFQWMNVQNMNPYIGDSHNFTKYYINRVLNYNVVASEGILFMILCYGITIGLFCYYTLIKSSIYWGRTYGKSNYLLFFGLFMIINFSYNFWEFPLFMLIWLWPYFEHSNRHILIQKRF